ncbi:MAG: dual specificity protein phosphatase [Planctomycetota bacterium]
MNWINDHILIGNYVDAHNETLLSGYGVRSILGLDGKLQRHQAKELGVERIESFNPTDGPGNDPYLFKRIVDLLGELVRKNAPVLVHCHAGRSRSPTVVAGYLMKSESLAANEALRRIEKKREIQLTEGIETLLDAIG